MYYTRLYSKCENQCEWRNSGRMCPAQARGKNSKFECHSVENELQIGSSSQLGQPAGCIVKKGTGKSSKFHIFDTKRFVQHLKLQHIDPRENSWQFVQDACNQYTGYYVFLLVAKAVCQTCYIKNSSNGSN